MNFYFYRNAQSLELEAYIRKQDGREGEFVGVRDLEPSDFAQKMRVARFCSALMCNYVARRDVKYSCINND